MQNTSLKLSVTPQPRSIGEPTGVSTSHQMAIKVEGVVTSSQSSHLDSPFRSVSSVTVTASSQLISLAKSAINNGNSTYEGVKMSSTVQPHNDFFQAQFLIQFPVAGSHQVNQMIT